MAADTTPAAAGASAPPVAVSTAQSTAIHELSLFLPTGRCPYGDARRWQRCVARMDSTIPGVLSVGGCGAEEPRTCDPHRSPSGCTAGTIHPPGSLTAL